jgi:hypothetical protein
MSTLPLDANPLSVDDLTPARAAGAAATVDELLKKPALAARAIEAGADLTARTRTYVKVLIACTATFGAALGFHRGGAQILYAAVKLPLVTLVTLAVVAPLLHMLNRALERPANMARDVSTLVAALARGALVLAAETPLIWAAYAVGADYHRTILITVLACAVAGALSFWFLWGVLSATRRSRWPVALVVLTTMGIVGAQATWLFRPYLVRPRATGVVFMHPLEGSFSEAVGESIDSARGRYRSSTDPARERSRSSCCSGESP